VGASQRSGVIPLHSFGRAVAPRCRPNYRPTDMLVSPLRLVQRVATPTCAGDAFPRLRRTHARRQSSPTAQALPLSHGLGWAGLFLLGTSAARSSSCRVARTSFA
jgi:hypothetical protein